MIRLRYTPSLAKALLCFLLKTGGGKACYSGLFRVTPLLSLIPLLFSLRRAAALAPFLRNLKKKWSLRSFIAGLYTGLYLVSFGGLSWVPYKRGPGNPTVIISGFGLRWEGAPNYPFMSRHTRLSPWIQRLRQRHKGCRVIKVPCPTPLLPCPVPLPHIPRPDRHTRPGDTNRPA